MTHAIMHPVIIDPSRSFASIHTLSFVVCSLFHQFHFKLPTLPSSYSFTLHVSITVCPFHHSCSNLSSYLCPHPSLLYPSTFFFYFFIYQSIFIYIYPFSLIHLRSTRLTSGLFLVRLRWRWIHHDGWSGFLLHPFMYSFMH